MALTSNTIMTDTDAGRLKAIGSRTGTRTAADFTIVLGFAPKKIRVINLTDRVEAEYWVDSGLDSVSGNVKCLKTVAAGTRTYEDCGLTVLTTEGASGRQFTVDVSDADLETDDDDVVWEAYG